MAYDEFGPKVSIIVPIYNVSAYIERCLSSIINQTYTNIECILVDDMTPDDSIEKCKKMIDSYTGDISFSIIRHERNRGLSAARNSGTDVAKGEYIYYLDSDDEITPECIEIFIEALRKHPELELIQGKIKAVPNKPFYDRGFIEDIDYVDDNLWVREHFYVLGEKLPLNAWDKLLKKSFIEEHSLYFKEGLIHEDQLWMFFVVKKLSKYAVVHQTTYIHYCGVEGSIMSTSTKERSAYHWSLIYHDITNNFDEPLYDNQLLCYLVLFIEHYIHKGNVSYDKLLSKFKELVLHRRFYLIYMGLVIMKAFFPLTKGKWVNGIVYHLILAKLDKISEQKMNRLFQGM